MDHYDKEYMKMAMLKHEETFREQVYELHRLYRIQKTLMKDIAKKQRSWNRGDVGEDDESDLELTLGPRSYYHKKIKSDSSSSTTANRLNMNSPPWLFQALTLNIT